MQTFTPGQDGYREEIAGFQTGIESAPKLVVAATTADDVAGAVRHAAARDLPWRSRRPATACAPRPTGC
ncbi:hypothetical protein [Amycolatopsis sp. NPDC051372]|uniref:hypothetical protein n=1 Tax=Amycolatopsis sp. NPDC051372 TaxID=3155669 RepID=UPI0034382F73